MNISKLIKYLEEIKQEHGDCKIDIITETELDDGLLVVVNEHRALQSEQRLDGVAYSPSEKRVNLLP